MIAVTVEEQEAFTPASGFNVVEVKGEPPGRIVLIGHRQTREEAWDLARMLRVADSAGQFEVYGSDRSVKWVK
jgi:hypothetical protein